MILQALTRLASPPAFYRLCNRLIPWTAGGAMLCFAYGLYGALVLAPPDYQQGDAFRIIYVHVPSAWMSLQSYVMMAVLAFGVLVWRIKVAELLLVSCAPIGAVFTLIALLTGSLWGKPMWGSWWVWDARLTSELLLFFLYLGIIGLSRAADEPRQGARAAALLTVVGLANIPIVHFSVQWWHTLHQGSTVFRSGQPAIATEMLIPLLVMWLAFFCYLLWATLLRARLELLQREQGQPWLQGL